MTVTGQLAGDAAFLQGFLAAVPAITVMRRSQTLLGRHSSVLRRKRSARQGPKDEELRKRVRI